MSKFKIGDKVVRLAGSKSGKFSRLLECKDYYTVTTTSPGGYWLQVDGVLDGHDPVPWHWANFELYLEPEDEGLPPAPTSVLYIGVQDRYRALTVRPYDRFKTGEWYVDLHIGGGVIGDGKSCSLSADDVLRLAHDLRRMAMEVRRKERAKN